MTAPIDEVVARRLQDEGVRFCVVGAWALAAHQYPRSTGDIDLLTMDQRVLDRAFWRGIEAEIRRGDDEDPLRGVVRFRTIYPVDLIVGRGQVSRLAVDTAEHFGVLGALVPTPVALLLLKLEAGAPHDLRDCQMLITTLRARRGDDSLVSELAEHAELLSAWGKRAYQKLLADLAEATRP